MNSADDHSSGKSQAALAAMEHALKILDETSQSAHIGAHLDLAICELRAAMDIADVERNFTESIGYLSPQDSIAWPKCPAA